MNESYTDQEAAGQDLSPRVLLLTYPGVFGAAVIQTIAAGTGFDLVGVGLSHRVFKGKGYLRTGSTLLARTGLPYTVYGFYVTDFAWAILRLLKRPRALGRLDENVRYIRDINSRETIEWIASLSPDYIASCYFNQLIGDEVVKVASRACVNMHPALLPALRGPDPCFRVMDQGLKTSGFTVHLVDEDFDTGNILHQESCHVPETDSLFSMNMEMWSAGARVLTSWLAGEQSTDDAEPQPKDGGEYYKWPTPKEVRAFRRKGYRLMRIPELLNGLRQIS